MRQRAAVVALSLAAAAFVEPAWAIPAFARRYKVNCHFCHDGYPKLNPMGERFKERGFRMPREDSFKAETWLASAPVTGRLTGNHFFFEDADGSSFAYLKAVSAGNLGTRVAYWVDDSVLVPDGGEDVIHVKPDNAWLRFEVVPKGKLYARVGRMELDLLVSQTRTPHQFSYDVYGANTGFETDGIGEHQNGIEVGGELPGDARWSAAVVKGKNAAAAEALSDEPGSFDGNLFLRLAKRVDRHRFGGFAYIGRNTLAREFTQGGRRAVAVWNDSLLRLGGDASVWLGRLNLYGAYIYGRNDNSIATFNSLSGTRQSLSYYGGFAQADYRLRDQVAVTMRVNAVKRPPGSSAGPREGYSSLFPGVQVFIFDHGRLSFEYGFLNKGRPSLGALQAEVAF